MSSASSQRPPFMYLTSQKLIKTKSWTTQPLSCWNWQKNIDIEELEAEAARSDGDSEGGQADSMDGWIDKRLELSDVKYKELDDRVLPVQLLLVKVSSICVWDIKIQSLTWNLQLHKLSYAIINSTTLLLPKWFSTLEDLKLDECTMPQDVSMHWNSTYDMLKFAIDYWKVIDRLTGDKNLGLQQHKLSDDEWEIAKQLSSLLMVRTMGVTTYKSSPRYSKTWLCSFHAWHPTSPLSFQPWTTLMSGWQQPLSTQSFPCPSTQLQLPACPRKP